MSGFIQSLAGVQEKLNLAFVSELQKQVVESGLEATSFMEMMLIKYNDKDTDSEVTFDLPNEKKETLTLYGLCMKFLSEKEEDLNLLDQILSNPKNVELLMHYAPFNDQNSPINNPSNPDASLFMQIIDLHNIMDELNKLHISLKTNEENQSSKSKDEVKTSASKTAAEIIKENAFVILAPYLNKDPILSVLDGIKPTTRPKGAFGMLKVFSTKKMETMTLPLETTEALKAYKEALVNYMVKDPLSALDSFQRGDFDSRKKLVNACAELVKDNYEILGSGKFLDKEEEIRDLNESLANLRMARVNLETAISSLSLDSKAPNDPFTLAIGALQKDILRNNSMVSPNSDLKTGPLAGTKRAEIIAEMRKYYKNAADGIPMEYTLASKARQYEEYRKAEEEYNKKHGIDPNAAQPSSPRRRSTVGTLISISLDIDPNLKGRARAEAAKNAPVIIKEVPRGP